MYKRLNDKSLVEIPLFAALWWSNIAYGQRSGDRVGIFFLCVCLTPSVDVSAFGVHAVLVFEGTGTVLLV